MPIASIIALLQTVVSTLPGAITTATQLYDLGKKFFAVTNGTAPSADEMLQLQAAIDADVAIALQPLPPAQPGDPDFNPNA